MHIKKLLFKTLKISGITLGSIILLIILLPILFPQAVNRKIDQWVNNNINGKITFSHTHLTFFKHFPSLTLVLFDVTLKGSAPFQNDTLVSAENIGLGLDISSVFERKITINKVFLNNAFVNIQVDSMGNANYNIYKQSGDTTAGKSASDSSGASLGINKIDIKNSRLVYNDRSLPMTIIARGFNYQGSGDLSKEVFSLTSHTDIASLDFYYAKQPYVIGKKINADLITDINTKSLAFVFQKNNLFINQFPVEFNGRFAFIKDGYDMDFNIDSHENDLAEIITALPSGYQKLLEKTELRGTGNIQIGLTGKYIAKDSIMPGLTLNVKVRNGYINNRKSPVPVSNLYLDMNAKLPGFNMDSFALNIDSLHFIVGDGYFNSVLRVKGMQSPDIYARVNSEIDLEQWHKAMGVEPFAIKGKYSLHLLAEGRYTKSIEKIKGLRKRTDTVITSIPKFTLRSTFRHGYFKYATLPKAVDNISFDLYAECRDNDYKNISIALDSLDITALDSYLKGYISLGNITDFPVNAALRAQIHLQDIKQFFPADSMELSGDLDANIQANGNYEPSKKTYPVLAANITLHNGSVKTKYYPHPVENIEISTTIADTTGSLKGLNVSVNPVSFTFENEPFLFKAKLRDFTDLSYKVHLKGTLDIGKIYQVFAIKGYNVTGTIAANLSLKGKQSDAVAGNYDKLQNKGTLRVSNLYCKTELYPMPFIVSKGSLHFNQDNMRLDTFTVQYAHSQFVLDGSVSNVINYVTKPGSVLKGELDLKSDLLVVDDFMAFTDTSKTSSTTPQASAQASSGVVLVPKNLDLMFTAEVKQVRYNDMVLTDAKGKMLIQKDSILLHETGFNIIGAPITMNASYTGINPNKAFFYYSISAKDFDVQKAYKNIKMFRVIASSAEHAEGLISLDYQLSGYLNSGMMPIYPSLTGGGVVSAKKISMHGFKLFNAIGKESGQDSLGGNSEVSKVSLKTTIANNIITLEKTKIRISGFRLKMQGQTSFGKDLNLDFRLGLPPLGVIGIPMTITGTADNPKIQIRKGKEADDLKETADADD